MNTGKGKLLCQAGEWAFWCLRSHHLAFLLFNKEGRMRGRRGGGEKKRTDRAKVYLTSEGDHQRECVHKRISSRMVRRVPIQTSPRTPCPCITSFRRHCFVFVVQNFTVSVQTSKKALLNPLYPENLTVAASVGNYSSLRGAGSCGCIPFKEPFKTTDAHS